MLIIDYDFIVCVIFVDGAYLGQGDGGEEIDNLGQFFYFYYVGQLQ